MSADNRMQKIYAEANEIMEEVVARTTLMGHY
jgi:hypothetical protein